MYPFVAIPIFDNIKVVFTEGLLWVKNTSISLGPHFDKFIEKQLKSGRSDMRANN